jgi:hypothetical protein
MKQQLKDRLNYANVVATIALFVALGGGAMAASHIGKNSVGAKQIRKNAVTAAKIKKNAVTAAKIKKQAVTAAKVKNGSLTGRQINASTLGTVPTAQTANGLAPPEAWHEVGTPGEPGFQGGWKNAPGFIETVAFYKDQEGVVHLKGTAAAGTTSILFQLPAGYRPAPGRTGRFAASCSGGPCTAGTSTIIISGPNTLPGFDGAIVVPPTVTNISLDGITFRAAA